MHKTFCRPRDPPGQRSVYIPPGDTKMESYRLSTFIRFPSNSPVNPRVLAAVGFFYTGYKDRVKCFSCANCVDNWTIEDDVTSSHWHKGGCAFMQQEDCGNVPLGKCMIISPDFVVTNFREPSDYTTSCYVWSKHINFLIKNFRMMRVKKVAEAMRAPWFGQC